MMRVVNILLVVLFAVGVGLFQQCEASPIVEPNDCVDIRSFINYAVNVGESSEDWQPAFQKAVEEAYLTGKPIYVPTGEYKIRSVIDAAPPVSAPNSPFWDGNSVPISIIGDGKGRSVIRQMVSSENIINWTGPSSQEALQHGSIYGLGLWEGNIALNIQWHKNFTIDSCYIFASKKGVCASAANCRIVNSAIRKCTEIGIEGNQQFNNCLIRDCYLGRNTVAIYLSGGKGIRIEGVAIEMSGSCGIYVTSVDDMRITSSYFEGNGAELMYGCDIGPGHPSDIHLDYAANGVSIKDNILRGCSGAFVGENASIRLSYCVEAKIINNTFLNSDRVVRLIADCEDNPGFGNYVADTIVRNNYLYNIEYNWLSEEVPGLIDTAISRGSIFEE